MLFTYTQEGAETKSWEFAPQKLMNVEAEVIERHTGMTFGQWSDAVGNSSMLALHGLLFVMLKREIPTLKWDDVQFSLSEIAFEYSEDEKAEIRGVLHAKRDKGTLTADEAEALAEIGDGPVTSPEEATDPKEG